MFNNEGHGYLLAIRPPAYPMPTYLELTAAIFHLSKLKHVEVIIEMSFDQLDDYPRF
jgi:hypothetical protein